MCFPLMDRRNRLMNTQLARRAALDDAVTLFSPLQACIAGPTMHAWSGENKVTASSRAALRASCVFMRRFLRSINGKHILGPDVLAQLARRRVTRGSRESGDAVRSNTD